jgi:hypothetical protein
MAAKLSALRAGSTLPPGFFILKDSEGLGQFKKSTSLGLEPATFRFVA